MRQRQEAWKRQREEKERQAEQHRQEEETRQREVQRQEQERERKIKEAADRIRWEKKQRQWAIEAEAARQRREVEDRQRREQAEAAERDRLHREQQERQAAQQWWNELSATQFGQLRDAVAAPVWRHQAARVEFDGPNAAAGNAYGIAVYLRRRLYGILRPSPASLHRLPPDVAVFVRNAREAQRIIDTGKIDPMRVVHFNMPDHEQMTLL